MNKPLPTRCLDDLLKDGKEYLSKWSVLDDARVNTINQGKLYAGFSPGFNDVFDTQVRISDDAMENLICKLYDYKCNNLDFYQLKQCLLHVINNFHHIHIACFSERDPINVESNRMWGGYGGNGLGVALQYHILDLKSWFEGFSLAHNWSEFIDVAYSDDTRSNNKLMAVYEIFLLKQRSVEEMLADPKTKKIVADIIANRYSLQQHNDYKNRSLNTFEENIYRCYLFMISVKGIEWQDEKEWRFIHGNSSISTNYANINKPRADIISEIKNYYINDDGSINHQKMQFDFIKPSRVIFGWKTHNSGELHNNLPSHKRLRDWAIKQGIEVVYLDTTINYNDNCFNQCVIS